MDENTIRARELNRYIQVRDFENGRTSFFPSRVDTKSPRDLSFYKLLEPYCQLVALQCDVKKAFISFMDRDSMYFVAEASPTNLSDNTRLESDCIEDHIFQKCSAVPLSGRICEITVRQKRSNTKPIPMFTVSDLLESDFAHLPPVVNPPHFRFYAGTPVTTKEGINIGSLAVMDDRPRQALNPNQERFLVNIADRIVDLLDEKRHAFQGFRSRAMITGLEQFLAGKHELVQRTTSSRQEATSQRLYALTKPYNDKETQNHSDSSATFQLSNFETAEIPSENGCLDSPAPSCQVTPNEHDANSDPENQDLIFGRAANILRQCLELEDQDTAMFVRSGTSLAKSNKHSSVNGVYNTKDGLNTDYCSQSRVIPDQPIDLCSVVAVSSQVRNYAKSAELNQYNFRLDDVLLRYLVQKYPLGHIWALNKIAEDCEKCQAEDSEQSRIKCKICTSQEESTALRQIFPNAHEVLFAPLFNIDPDPVVYGAFVVICDATRSFDIKVDLGFVKTFNSAVMAECNRTNAIVTGRQKDDFVGTISHEMRSPLHGILASNEFLADTTLTDYQKSLLLNVGSCANTLLDTINHVLDFSKINDFSNKWLAERQKSIIQLPGAASRIQPPIGNLPERPALLQTSGLTNLGVILEEVLDSLLASENYYSDLNLMDPSHVQQGRDTMSTHVQRTTSKKKPVEIILEIEHANFMFVTSPGAIRRLMLNIVGNAMKFTASGTIVISLKLATASTEKTEKDVILTVTDTGRGVSTPFLTSKIFLPFTQEDPLSPGTGLGLSVVQKIVNMLGGTVTITSKVNEGTVVRTILPMTRGSSKDCSGETSLQKSIPTAGSISSNAITILREQKRGLTAALYGAQIHKTANLSQSVRSYLSDWLSISVLDDPELAQILVLDEADFPSAVSLASRLGRQLKLVVFRDCMTRNSVIDGIANKLGNKCVIEFATKPCGPQKLARSLKSAIEKAEILQSRSLETKQGLKSTEEHGLWTPTEDDSPKSTLQELKLDINGDDKDARPVKANHRLTVRHTNHHGQTPITPLSSRSPHPTVLEQVEGSGQESTSKKVQPDKAISLRKPRILLVDDNAINIRLLETFLRNKRKYQDLTTAFNGQEAVDAVSKGFRCDGSAASLLTFDIIFMDISMPIMDGFTATTAIRALEASYGQQMNRAMIIALTGLASGRDQGRGLDSGCDVYMTKPASFKQIGALLDNWEAHHTSGT